MARPPALAAYLALARLRPAAAAEEGARPRGTLAWLHAQDPGRAPALLPLARHLLEEEGIASLLTVPPGAPLPEGGDEGEILRRHAPVESTAAIRAFLGRWSPDLLVWIGGALRPALLAEAAVPRILVEGAPEGRLLRRGDRVPGLARAVVPLFDRAVVADAEAAARLRRAGLAGDRIALAPPLGPPPPVLPCSERDRRDLAAQLGARPVWLAGDLPLSELPEVIAAQALASRSAHRLLAIVAPREAAEGPRMAQALAAAGLRVASQAEGEAPAESVQAFVADGTAEMGLWLRLAPLAFIGGTLPASGGGRDPFEAAALGSAILHGPRTAPWEAHWRRLAAAGAARLVRTGAEMGAAVESLLAPDRMASMAHGAWDVATQGADSVARVATLARELLDARGARPGPA